jgi:hypothetical protein
MSKNKMTRHLEQTELHRERVAYYMERVIKSLVDRTRDHDLSKLQGDEAKGFADMLEILENNPYGSEPYMEALKSPCIQKHYKANRHHPEHFEKGVSGMTLVDVIEMWCDWQAACERREDGDISKSVEFNAKRFGPCSLWDILRNQAEGMSEKRGLEFITDEADGDVPCVHHVLRCEHCNQVCESQGGTDLDGLMVCPECWAHFIAQGRFPDK